MKILLFSIFPELAFFSGFWGLGILQDIDKSQSHVEVRVRDKSKRSLESPLTKHDQIYHPDIKEGGTYTMRIEKVHQRPLQRQVHEAVLIETAKVDILLNSKSEFNYQS